MNFNFSEEQRQFRDSLDRYVREAYSFEARRAIIASEAGWSREVWQQLAEMGALAIALPEAHDGFGGGAFDTLLVANSLAAMTEWSAFTHIILGEPAPDQAPEPEALVQTLADLWYRSIFGVVEA